jgi:predicted nucleic acid-binding protein
MAKKIIADTGVLVGLLVGSDRHHRWSVEQFKRFPVLHTCEAVVAEACARLRYKGFEESAVLELLEAGVVKVDFEIQANIGRAIALMKKYADSPMDFADACVVLMSEAQRDCLVLTVDKTDFDVYRRFGRDVIPAAFPPD